MAQLAIGSDLDQRQVGRGVDAAHLGGQLARVVADGDHQLAGALDDVVVGGDEPVAADDEAAAARFGAELLRPLRPALRVRLVAAVRAEEEVEERIVLLAGAPATTATAGAAGRPAGIVVGRVAVALRRLLEAHRADGDDRRRHRLGKVGEPRQPAAVRHDVFEAAVRRHTQPEPVAGLGRLDLAVDESARQVRGRPQVRHLAHRGAAHRTRVLIVSRRPRRQVKGDVLSEIGGRGQQAAHRPEQQSGAHEIPS